MLASRGNIYINMVQCSTMATLERRPDEQNTVPLLQPLMALMPINIKITEIDYRQTHTGTYQ